MSRGNSRNTLKINGAPGRIRTCDLRIRSPALYPAELRARNWRTRILASRTQLVTRAVSSYLLLDSLPSACGHPILTNS